MSDAVQVREFTRAGGSKVPPCPEAMNVEEVNFIGKMILDEVMELLATVMRPEVAKDVLKTFIDQSKDLPLLAADDTANLIAEQADAFVDIYYYCLNAAAKKGVNLSAIFDVVHAANMAKRDPKTGQFLKREDGKIIKPEGWQPPDVRKEIQRQMSQGAWQQQVKRDADDVREFTVGAGQGSPEEPSVMSEEEVRFITKMIVDEVLELFATVHESTDAKNVLKGFVDASKDIQKIDAPEVDITAEQADAFVDIYYYCLNAAAKKGVNLSAIFDVVHAANMAKRDPKTGQFLKREDGKIIKPEGWQPPDVRKEIQRQMSQGAWPIEECHSAQVTPVKA